MLNRRQLFGSAAAVAGIAALNRTTALAQAAEQAAKPRDGKSPWMREPHPEPGEPGKHYKPTVTLNGSTLPWKLVDGVKVMHLVAEEVWHEFVPKTESNEALRATCWGYNGQVHGPTIECVEGDR